MTPDRPETSRPRFPLPALAALAAALTALAFPALAAAAPTDWTKLRTLNIAHQGGEDEAPSNTMYAYDRALRLGSDMLETDINTSADGQLIVIHDGTVDRTTNGTGSVGDMTLDQLRQLDAGYWTVPGKGTDHSDRPASDYPFRGVATGDVKPPPGSKPSDFRMTTLPQVMEKYPHVPINIEIKGQADETDADYLHNAEVLAAFLNDLGRTKGIVVASFNDAALAHFHELAPQIDMAPATGGVAGYVLADTPPPEGSKVFQVPMTFSGIPVVTPEFVDKAHGDGYAVHPWTIDDEPTMKYLFGLGVDGIMSAQPMRLEKTMCNEDVSRPPVPGGSPGKHCTKKSSVACDVRGANGGFDFDGNGATVAVKRRDDFNSRCAGTVVLETKAGRRLAKGRFNFGWQPPSAGGPDRREVGLGQTTKLGRAIANGRPIRAVVQPYDAFVRRTVYSDYR
ncbi:MAG: glycerophosphodiester phosphodiesterase [Solirubrobacterales bacterium]|nr:glycerophosphodiester phosphodiesterase [Solirubrobacterales bacterium]